MKYTDHKKKKLRNNEKGYFFSNIALMMFLVSIIFIFIGSNQNLSLRNSLHLREEYLSSIIEERNTDYVILATLNSNNNYEGEIEGLSQPVSIRTLKANCYPLKTNSNSNQIYYKKLSSLIIPNQSDLSITVNNLGVGSYLIDVFNSKTNTSILSPSEKQEFFSDQTLFIDKNRLNFNSDELSDYYIKITPVNTSLNIEINSSCFELKERSIEAVYGEEGFKKVFKYPNSKE